MREENLVGGAGVGGEGEKIIFTAAPHDFDQLSEPESELGEREGDLEPVQLPE